MHPCFWPKLAGKNSFALIQCFIYLYLDTYFLYYKGTLALIFEHIMVQERLYKNNYKTQHIQGVSGTTHV